ncbi:MAG: hypothetical protein ACSHW0_00900 [Thalassotalea sp.]
MTIVVHCILPCDQNDKAKVFYSKLFPNWRFKSQPPNEFWEITNEDGAYPHKVYLAMMKGPGTPSQPTNYYTVPQIDEYVDKAVSLGAKLVVAKTPVPGKGHYAELRDINNQPFGFWQDQEQQ